MVDVMVRKKILKIQERLGMRLGLAYGTKKTPVVRNSKDMLDTLQELYNIGLKAFVLPSQMFAGIQTASDLYKSKYGELLKIKDEAKRYNIELTVRFPNLPQEPDETMRIYSTIASIMDCRNFIIQPNFYSKIMPHDQALKLAVFKINEVISNMSHKIKVGIETTGTIGDVGSLEDVIDIVRRTHNTEPVINWGHIQGREKGTLQSRRDFNLMLNQLRETVGRGYFQSVYFLFSAVRYGKNGYIESIPYAKGDINLEHMIRESMSAGAKGTLIIEDPDREAFILRIMDQLADMVR
ncbi:MAG: hypothetical protein HY519_03580 [Candidatus Aenigmarchaeota archaeon]|nr:hypothetical protein [Candidatus Aenigmarchaeota archaeon]